jgi:hypothetical protein
MAVLSLALFLLAYVGLAGSFALQAWHLTLDAGGSAGVSLLGWLVGGCSAFLALFMLKAVLFVRHGGGEHRVELSAAQQPELFRFLNDIARQTGAPQLDKVYLSPPICWRSATGSTPCSCRCRPPTCASHGAARRCG